MGGSGVIIRRERWSEVLAHGTVNPWGHDWDEHGELFFINTVIGHMWHLIPGAHYRESGSGASQNPLIYERMHQHADHFHYDTNLAWHRSRYGAANDFGGGHAHVGMAILSGGSFSVEWEKPITHLEPAWQEAQSGTLEERGEWICR